MEYINLYISIPICSFRKPYAREFFETSNIPPPATVYGFLLSLIGEDDRYAYTGSQIAIAVLQSPSLSHIIRTTWRIKSTKQMPGVGNNKKPDYQGILTGLELLIQVAEGELMDKISLVFESCDQINRFGGLSLGESRDLVNDIVINPYVDNDPLDWLSQKDDGDYPLPVWVDHVGAQNTVWGQYALKNGNWQDFSSDESRWITIENK